MALKPWQERAKARQVKYWKDRERENYLINQREEIDYDRELQRIYDELTANIERDIDAFYGRYADKNGITINEARKRVSALDIKVYEQKAKQYVIEKDFSPQANREMELYNLTMKVNRLELLKAEIGLELCGGFSEIEKMFGEKLNQRTLNEFKRQAGILGQTVDNPLDNARAIVGASFHNATFSDRIWTNQALLHHELSSLIQSGMVAGRNPRELARQLRKTTTSSRYDSERLLRTELARVQTEAQKQSFEMNGFDEYVFISLETGCEICRDMDDPSKHYKVRDMQIGLNAPPMHPHCRCSIAAAESEDDYEKWLDELVGPEEGEV